MRAHIPEILRLLFFILLCQDAAAQSEEEMQILRMFYKEKDLIVYTATRYPKPISQAAENMTVVTAKEIEMMNAHTVAEVLNRIPGMFISFNQDFGAASIIHMQGAEDRHTLVLVDGMAWNFITGGNAETNSIPVGIIERIEVIKGPASSAWGSSLGGVVNIITKEVGTSEKPTGSVSASYGKKDSQDYRTEAAGKAGPLGYYLFAGGQDSDGLRSRRDFDTYSLYSKAQVSISDDVKVNLSMGYSQPNIGFGDYPSQDFTSDGLTRAFFATGAIETAFTKELTGTVSLFHFKQKFVQMNDTLGLGMVGPQGELYLDQSFDEETTSASGKLVWERGNHTALLGADISDGALDQQIDTGPFLQSYGAPARSVTHPELDKHAIYVNDTIIMDNWSVTPGIRFDDNNLSGSFVSPSLGVTYRVYEKSILRASVARGFTNPPLSWISGGALFLDPNPSLDPEKVWSYQLGMESNALTHVWVKATTFRHEIDDTLTLERFAGAPLAYNDLYVNKGDATRQGIEVEAETAPVYNVSLLAGYAFVDLDPVDESGVSKLYSYDIGIRYNDRDSFKAELFGHYLWWDLDPDFDASYDDFIWDINLNKNLWSKERNRLDVFFAAHNLFNGDQYVLGDQQNHDRWAEAGIRIRF